MLRIGNKTSEMAVLEADTAAWYLGSFVREGAQSD
jgi:hypothetical protein